ncbi:uncharacterized protein LOC34622075 [Cyclospora cayetanensis]|nr:uncharacterized protein LOC34622075 [Cyclospora cayetanensis]
MPLPTTPAGALAQSIAAKQRSSTIFDDAPPLRRPSACSTDRQTQLFVRNLRTTAPPEMRSPSISRSSSNFSAQLQRQTLSRAQQSYMRTTSSSRSRSRNPLPECNDLSPHQSQPQYSSSTRVRSPSPYRVASMNSVPAVATHSTGRTATLRQGQPPLPRARRPFVQRSVDAEQHSATRQHHTACNHDAPTVGKSLYSWQAKKMHQDSLEEQQKLRSLSSSWTVQDPLKSAGTMRAGLGESDDGPLELDASDQRELSQITASLEMHRLFPRSATTYSTQAGTTQGPLASGTVDAEPKTRQQNQTSAGFALLQESHETSLVPRTTEHQQQRKGILPHLIQPSWHQQKLQQQQPLSRPWPCPQQQDTTPSVDILEPGKAAEVGKFSGVSGRRGVGLSTFGVSAFGEESPEGKGAYSGMANLFGLFGWCARFALVLVVCLWRLLNTSYDSWSARQFKESFMAQMTGESLIGEGLVGEQSQLGVGGMRKTNGEAGAALKSQSLLHRITARQAPHRHQHEQQDQSCHVHRDKSIVPGGVPRSTSLEGLTLSEAHGRRGGHSSLQSFNVCNEQAGMYGSLLPKALSLAVAAFCLVCWLFMETPREEFVDFDFM